MRQTENIQRFTMGAAYYHVGGKDGEEVVLQIDYQNNTYAIDRKSKLLGRAFQQELSVIAQDLLKRKHGVNFAEKLRQKQ